MQGKPWPATQWKFYMALALFRGAAIYSGIHSRWIMVISEEKLCYFCANSVGKAFVMEGQSTNILFWLSRYFRVMLQEVNGPKMQEI